MNLIENLERADEALWHAPFDLSDVACRAAVELDNLLLGREKRLNATKDLVRHLAASIPEDAKGAAIDMDLDPTIIGHLEKFKVSLQNKEAPLCPCA